MHEANIPGVVARSLINLAFIPQVLEIWNSRHARDISPGMFSTFGFGVLLWLIVGIQMESLPVITSNALTFELSLVIPALKIQYMQ
ncbi:MAG: PQ-loop domain-containing transporter [Gammaproteobacteria bacterium]